MATDGSNQQESAIGDFEDEDPRISRVQEAEPTSLGLGQGESGSSSMNRVSSAHALGSWRRRRKQRQDLRQQQQQDQDQDQSESSYNHAEDIGMQLQRMDDSDLHQNSSKRTCKKRGSSGEEGVPTQKRSRSWNNLVSLDTSGLAHASRKIQQGTSSMRRKSIPIRHQRPVGQPKRHANQHTSVTSLNDLVRHATAQASMIQSGHHDSISSPLQSSAQINLMPVRSHFLRGEAGMAKASKFVTTKQRKTTQRESPKRSHQASCFWEVIKQINPFSKSSVLHHSSDLDNRIGQGLANKSLRDRAHDEWALVDRDQDGKADFREVKLMFARLNVRVPEREIRKWMDHYDTDGNGTLDFEEFTRMFEGIQSKPNLMQEFLVAKILGSGQESIDSVVAGDVNVTDLRLRPEDLMKFVAWSTNGEDEPTLVECAYRIHHFECDRKILSHPDTPWTIPSYDQLLISVPQSSPALNGIHSFSQDSLALNEEETAHSVGGYEPSMSTLRSSGSILDPQSVLSPTSAMTEDVYETENNSSRLGSEVSAFSAPTQQQVPRSLPQITRGFRIDRSLTATTRATFHSAFIKPRRGSDVSSSTASERGGKRHRLKRFLSRMRVRARSQDSVPATYATGGHTLRQRVSSAAPQYPEWHPLSPNYVPPELSYEAFVCMMVDGLTNSVGNYHKLHNVYQDMHQPLSHYFISSSHNSYLSGNQLYSESTAYAIIRALRLGVRVIELDAWNGPSDDPIVTHGNTLCKPMPFRDCIVALRKHGFDASEYPVIITIENHCSMDQQRKQVYYLESILGDDLLRFPTPDESNLKVGVAEWLSPYQLRHKFVIRDRPDKRMTKTDKLEIKMRKLELQHRRQKHEHQQQQQRQEQQRQEQYFTPGQLDARQTASTSQLQHLRQDSSTSALILSQTQEDPDGQSSFDLPAPPPLPRNKMIRKGKRGDSSGDSTDLAQSTEEKARFHEIADNSSPLLDTQDSIFSRMSSLTKRSSNARVDAESFGMNSQRTSESSDDYEKFEEGAEQSDEELLDEAEDLDDDDVVVRSSMTLNPGEFGEFGASSSQKLAHMSGNGMQSQSSVNKSKSRKFSKPRNQTQNVNVRSTNKEDSKRSELELGEQDEQRNISAEGSPTNGEMAMTRPRLTFLSSGKGHTGRSGPQHMASEGPSNLLNEPTDGGVALSGRKEFPPYILARYNDESKDGVTPSLLRLMYIKNIPVPVIKSDSTGEAVVFKAPSYRTSSSIAEQKMRKLASPGPSAAAICSYAKTHLLRIFPAGSRITSSNYDPVPAWNVGCQIVALNYQNFGTEVWLNQGKFQDNGGCGFVLKPSAMLNSTTTGVDSRRHLANMRGTSSRSATPPSNVEGFFIEDEVHEVGKDGDDHSYSQDMNGAYGVKEQGKELSDKVKRILGQPKLEQNSQNDVVGTLPWALQPGDASFDPEVTILEVNLISGHYLPRPPTVATSISPYVEITLRGLEQDDRTVRSTWVEHNGFDPFWGETFRFKIHNRNLALLSFIVRHVDGGRGKGRFVCQNVFPLNCLRQGYRYVAMRHANGALTDDGFLFCKVTLTKLPRQRTLSS